MIKFSDQVIESADEKNVGNDVGNVGNGVGNVGNAVGAKTLSATEGRLRCNLGKSNRDSARDIDCDWRV